MVLTAIPKHIRFYSAPLREPINSRGASIRTSFPPSAALEKWRDPPPKRKIICARPLEKLMKLVRSVHLKKGAWVMHTMGEWKALSLVCSRVFHQRKIDARRQLEKGENGAGRSTSAEWPVDDLELDHVSKRWVQSSSKRGSNSKDHQMQLYFFDNNGWWL